MCMYMPKVQNYRSLMFTVGISWTLLQGYKFVITQISAQSEKVYRRAGALRKELTLLDMKALSINHMQKKGNMKKYVDKIADQVT